MSKINLPQGRSVDRAAELLHIFSDPTKPASSPDYGITKYQLLAITAAYEQGVGKGRQSVLLGVEVDNPYSPAYRCDEAWNLGYKEGKSWSLEFAAYQCRRLDAEEGWSIWSLVQPADVEFWKKRVATYPNEYELRGLIVST